ncbi:helix-turn-helix domain-containing protein [Sulfitobacter pseudonitzschiae]|uniref:Helix-turn-helix domain-containing protein n=1 Tax=Pseudosulfitobacter pseudonitzschiae TaxID=1402135 RepID=A0A9Q2NWG9_9RHOB|nr:helix-turn-helix domain-containing protein [Pseudosulfitobacter pseudonitzschiae]MBM2293762.1 helix-turn-helix domain-containing protein [Pseudosulfitobacter pseudonitzschiae]MBM2298680.1 helix-turn-helix domain-containing protein [Pseudosulfitobacter pseudonitzschiae]MBM2303594.1 helix-turn-helix domain-containing protein [Pseudosulfitobacter pseudonitzschiae]MBM2313377.1 helix-turn-helix domain-containing protein [Pseudosulfitobacter pseudonitzschiae]MBM2318290.1 helix-turn-helix domain-c
MTDRDPQNGGGRKPAPLTVGLVTTALEQTGGIKVAAAQMLGVGRTTLYKFIKENPELATVIAEIDEIQLDLAEGQVKKLIGSGDPQTCRWFLELKGGGRGYSRHSTLGGKNGGPIQVEMPTVDVSGLSMAALKEIRAAQIRSEDEQD